MLIDTSFLALLHFAFCGYPTILQLGYFKARHLFFTFRFPIVAADVEHIRKRYFPEFQLNQLDLGKVTRLNQQRLILELCNYRTCDDEARAALKSKAQQAARVCGKPIYIFRELVHHLEKQRLIAPGYSILQNIVGQAITYEQARLSTIIHSHLEETDIAALNQLLEDTPGLYEITQLKREPRDFSLSEIKREIYRGEQIQALYPLAQRLLPALKISSESIKYYASLVTYYSVFRLKRLAQSMVHVYLLCFIFHRYQRLHDNLISSLRYNVRRYIEASKVAAKEQVYEYRIEGNQNLQKAGQVLKLFTDDSIAKTASFQEVQAKAFEILERQKLDFVAEHIVTQAKFDETAFQWEHVDTLAPQFKRNLRPVLLSVEFATSLGHTPLMMAIDFLKIAFQKGRSLTQYSPDRFPTQFIPDSTKRYLYASGEDDAKLLPDRYEFLVYRLLRNGLESGDVFCRDSVRFRSLEDDLIDEQQWQQKASLISATGLTLLRQPIRDHLAELEQRLETRITEVNQRLRAGENEHFEIKKRGSQVRWTLHSPRASDTINHPIFDGLKQVNIGSVLHFVNQRCQFIDAFEHLLGRYTKQDADKRTLIATLIAWGTNMGLGRMGETSDMGYHLLAATSDNFIRLETLREANDLVSNAIAELPIFRHYDIGKTLHSSSDGQKFESQIQTVNARHSPKYFGLKKGVVSYTLVANHVPVNARIIGANEHESHYVFDILFNNTTDIQPEVHSTDTHGANEVNFAILHMFGYQFAPRYRDIYDKVSNGLYGFKHPSQYEDEGPLKPIRKLNTALIIEEWDNIQRIMVSLALKTVTQSVIVGKLSAYARKNKTKRALWEYDNIIRSLYLLDYVEVSNGLYGFKHPSQYEDEGPLKPIRKLNTALIIEEWDNIQRIMVSLALKTVTQSVIVGKLSAYARKNKTKRALWEYDNIIRSLYLLDYVDSVPLRQNVQRALNRGESYHQLRRAVSYANFGKLRFKSEYEQQIWGDCARLLTNCIIYYNASILSNLLTYKEALGDMAGVALLSLISPVAWQHINFYGRYEFGKQPELIDLRAIIQQLARVPI